MPTAPSHSFIFVHIPKSGGTSVIGALRNAGVNFELDGRGIWERLGKHPRGAHLIRRLRAIYPINTIAGFWENHLPAELVREFTPGTTWDDAFKFAFVRNPWDLVVSTFFYIDKERASLDASEADFADVMGRCDFQQFVREYPLLFSDMSAMIGDETGRDIIDFVGRFERLEEDFAYVCRRIGIDAQLPHLNPSRHAHYREYYDAETREIVERHFARDIQRFGYAF